MINQKNQNSSLHKSIFSGMSIVAFFLIIGKAIAAIKEVVFAYRFGVEPVLDVYTLAFVLITWLPLLLVSIMQSILVPLINSMQGVDQRQFHNEMTGAVLLFGLFTIFSTVVFLLPVAPHIAGGFSSESVDQLRFALLFLTPVAVCTCLVGLYSSELLARGNHSNTLYDAVPSAVLIFIILGFRDSIGISGLLIGTVIGLIVQVLCLYFTIYRNYYTGGLSFKFGHRSWPGIIASIKTLLVGAFAMSLINPIDNYLSAQLPEGSVATLSYATRLLTLGVSLSVTVISRGLLPVLCQPSIEDGQRSAIAASWAKALFFVGIVLAVIAWPLVPFFVELLFERGKFSESATQDVSLLVQIGLIQLPFLFSGMALAQKYIAQRKYKIITISGIIALIVKLPTGLLLVGMFGLPGVMLSSVLTFSATCMYFYFQHSKDQ